MCKKSRCDLINYANLMAMLAVKQYVDTCEQVVLIQMCKHDATSYSHTRTACTIWISTGYDRVGGIDICLILDKLYVQRTSLSL